MLLCTILLNQRRSEVEVEVFGEKCSAKKMKQQQQQQNIYY